MRKYISNRYKTIRVGITGFWVVFWLASIIDAFSGKSLVENHGGILQTTALIGSGEILAFIFMAVSLAYIVKGDEKRAQLLFSAGSISGLFIFSFFALGDQMFGHHNPLDHLLYWISIALSWGAYLFFRKSSRGGNLDYYLEKVGSLKRGFDNVAHHVIITDKDANILYANKAAEKTTGFSIEEMLGKNPADLWGGNMSKEFYKDMWRKIKDEKQPFVGEVRNKKKDDTEYWQELHISPVMDGGSEVKYFIGIEPDITDRRTREQFQKEFISIVGHQLRNPLTAINWTLSWLFKEGSGLTKEQQKSLKAIYGQSKDLGSLVDDLLILSRVEKKGAKAEPVNLSEEIVSIIAATKKKFPALSISFNKAKDAVVVNTNKAFAYQIFTNIVTNAAEYSDKDSGKIEVSLKKYKRGYVFICKDNGVGIPKEDQPKIFGRFFRASNAYEAKKKGTGLGLFIVKMIADNLEWEVSFESKVGHGTTFFVKIPIKK